jgi:hypothetical protein
MIDPFTVASRTQSSRSRPNASAAAMPSNQSTILEGITICWVVHEQHDAGNRRGDSSAEDLAPLYGSRFDSAGDFRFRAGSQSSSLPLHNVIAISSR